MVIQTIPKQPLQGCPIARLNAHTGVHREADVLVGQHLFGVTTLQQAPAHEGEQDASAQIGLYQGHSRLVDSTGGIKNDAQTPIDCANMEVHMPVQAAEKY